MYLAKVWTVLYQSARVRRTRIATWIFKGTNFPPEMYDGHLFGKESYYDELNKQQKLDMDKREKVLFKIIRTNI